MALLSSKLGVLPARWVHGKAHTRCLTESFRNQHDLYFPAVYRKYIPGWVPPCLSGPLCSPRINIFWNNRLRGKVLKFKGIWTQTPASLLTNPWLGSNNENKRIVPPWSQRPYFYKISGWGEWCRTLREVRAFNPTMNVLDLKRS